LSSTILNALFGVKARVCSVGLLVALSATSSLAASGYIQVELHDPVTVNLWPGKPPRDVGIAGQETNKIYVSAAIGPTKLITNVSQQTLTILK
jgi:hypothetical protein